MVGGEAQCDPNLAQGPNPSLNFAQNWKNELLIRAVQDLTRFGEQRIPLTGSVLDFTRGCSIKVRKLVKKPYIC